MKSAWVHAWPVWQGEGRAPHAQGPRSHAPRPCQGQQRRFSRKRAHPRPLPSQPAPTPIPPGMRWRCQCGDNGGGASLTCASARGYARNDSSLSGSFAGQDGFGMCSKEPFPNSLPFGCASWLRPVGRWRRRAWRGQFVRFCCARRAEQSSGRHVVVGGAPGIRWVARAPGIRRVARAVVAIPGSHRHPRTTTTTPLPTFILEPTPPRPSHATPTPTSSRQACGRDQDARRPAYGAWSLAMVWWLRV